MRCDGKDLLAGPHPHDNAGSTKQRCGSRQQSMKVRVGLDATDVLVLKCGAETSINPERRLVAPDDIRGLPEIARLSDSDLAESLEVLGHSQLTLTKVIGQGLASIYAVRLTTIGFEQYASAFINDYREVKYAVADRLVNTGDRDNYAIAEAISSKPLVVEYIFEYLERVEGALRQSQEVGKIRRVTKVDAKLKRILSTRQFG